MLMLLTLFIKWWYTEGWKQEYYRISKRAKVIAKEMSLPILVKTLFQPWKQLVSHVPRESSLDDKFHAAFDNLFARCFGFVIRSVVIIASLIIIFITILASIVLVLVWPIIPVLPIVFMYLGLIK
jgi:hypothetical protein